MKTLLTISIIFLSLWSCKKKTTTPEPQPVQPVQCSQLKTSYLNGYFTYNTRWVDTLLVSVVDNTCTDQIKYKLVNLAGVMDSWGVTIQDRDYYVLKSTMIIQDTLQLEMKVENGTGMQYIRVSVKSNGVFTPYLEMPELKK